MIIKKINKNGFKTVGYFGDYREYQDISEEILENEEFEKMEIGQLYSAILDGTIEIKKLVALTEKEVLEMERDDSEGSLCINIIDGVYYHAS